MSAARGLSSRPPDCTVAPGCNCASPSSTTRSVALRPDAHDAQPARPAGPSRSTRARHLAVVANDVGELARLIRHDALVGNQHRVIHAGAQQARPAEHAGRRGICPRSAARRARGWCPSADRWRCRRTPCWPAMRIAGFIGELDFHGIRLVARRLPLAGAILPDVLEIEALRAFEGEPDRVERDDAREQRSAGRDDIADTHAAIGHSARPRQRAPW